MATMNGSGVRNVLVDESFQSFDTVNLNLMVPMMTKKGTPGKLNPVTVSNYQAMVGYDIDYNSNYLGLASLLSVVSQVQVLRINKDPYYGNVVIFQDGTFYQTDQVLDVDVLQAALCLRSKGFTLPGALTQTDSIGETLTPGSLKVFIGSIQYAHDDGLGALVFETGYTTAASGTITYDVAASLSITFPTGTPDTSNYTVQYTHASSVAAVITMKSPGDWDTLAISLTRYFETLQNFATSNTLSFTLPSALDPVADAYRIEDIAGNVIATAGAPDGGTHIATVTGTGVTGTVNFSTLAVSLTFDAGTFPAADYPMLLNHRYILNDPYYLLTVYRKIVTGASTSYFTLESSRVSFVSTQSNFAETVVFSNINILVMNPLQYDNVGNVTPVDLLYGNDGTMPSSTDLNFTGVDPSAFNLICMNGILGTSVVSAFIQYFEQFNIMTLWDIANVQTYVAAKQYHDSVYASEFQMAYWVSDFVTSGTRTYCIYPSVKAAMAYARMFKQTGYLNYPPAGYDFAAVSATQLLVTDAAIQSSALKQAKINYVIAKSSGPVIWEQRTGYAFESDLSYGSTVMTYVAFASRMKAFTENFPFRFVTPEILVTLSAGLQSIVNDYITRGFVWSATVNIPSFSQVKAAGARFMDINVDVKFAEDGEEFTFNFHVLATATS